MRKSLLLKLISESLVCLAAAAAAAALTGCGAPQASAPVVISELMSSNSRSLVDPVLGSPDWIELYNPSSVDVDLTGYRLTDDLKSDRGVLSGGKIRAGATLVVYADKSGAASAEGACRVGYNLPQAGETLYLTDPKNVVLCQVAVPALLTDESYARRSDGSYGFCTSSTPGGVNDDKGILDAGAFEARLKNEKLTLNEALPRAPDGNAWAEICNAGSGDADLSDFCLTDDRDDPMKWHFPKQTLRAGEYAVVSFAGEEGAGALNAGFRLGSHDTALYLFDISGNLVGSLAWQADIPKGVSAVPGGLYALTPTPGRENAKQTYSSAEPRAMAASDPVRISEALPKNKYGLMDADKNRCDWVELHNSGSMAVSLSGYYLSDNKNNLYKWAFPGVKINAGGYLVVLLSGKQGKPGELYAPFALSAGETGLYLTNLNDFCVDSLALPKEIYSDVSVGRGADGKPLYYARPTPGTANSKGVAALKQIGCFDKSGVYISEVCAANQVKSGLKDWIELHNGGSAAVDISGYYLSDDASDPKKWKIPKLMIPAGGYAVVYACSDSLNRDAGTAAFGISPQGETLLLSDAGGLLLDAFDTGELTAGVTSGRLEGNDKLARVYFTAPTPGKPNAKQSYADYVPAPMFSETGLYHTKAFQLGISCGLPGAKIYYTLDGSEPTSASKAYGGPIAISADTPVRAVAYASGRLPSAVTTETFLFDAPHTVPVFCICGKPADMSVLINTDKRNYKPEYAANVEYYEANGSFGISFPSGVRPKGRSSLTNPQNSFTMRLRGAYGESSVTYPFFPDSPITAYTTLTLRDSGQDNNAARIRDSYFQKADRGLDVDSIDTRLAVLYINGKYCGLYDLDEEQNADYIASHYGLQSGNIDMIDRNGTVISGDNKEFLRVSQLAHTWNTKDDKVFAELAKFVDVDACTDYLIARIYFGDGDVLNQRFWRARDYSEKWRPLLFDLDWSMRFGNADRNVFDRYFSPNPVAGNGTVTNMYIFCALKKNKAWCDKFVQRYVQLAETQFSPDRILGIYDGMVAAMEPEMQTDIDRWHTPRSMAAWQGQVSKLRSALVKRQAIALRQVQQFFHVSNSTMQKYIAEYSSKN